MDSVPVEVTRVPDRDELLRVLAERGLDARAVDGDWLGIEIPCGDGDDDQACADVAHQVETLIADAGLPLVPVLADGRIFVRPPGD